MAERKPFLLRLDPAVLQALQRWADDDLRSLNGHIEFLLRRALAEAGRASPKPPATEKPAPHPEGDDSPPPKKASRK
ncbi:MAG: hypothetical protein U0441_34385 [Polyangiaceae bacterium]